MNIIKLYKKNPTKEDCLKHLEHIRWNGLPICPYCKSDKHSVLKKEFRYHCNSCNTSYSVTVDTIFHKTKLPLQKWFFAISIILNAKKGISSRQLARNIEVTKDTACRMQAQIYKAIGKHKEFLQKIIN